MSSITGSCSESPSRELFELGIQKAEQRQLEEKKTDLSKLHNTVQGVEQSSPAVEGLKGALFDGYA